MSGEGNDGEMSRRRLLATALVATTAGCFSGSDGDVDGEEVEAIEAWGWDIAADALEIAANQYEQDHAASVTVTEFERPAMKEDLFDALATGEGAPEVAMLETIDAPETIDSRGGLRDLSDRIEADDLSSAFTEAAWNGIERGGSIYALPWDLGPVVVYYRRSIYDQYGIDPDAIETWDDFLAAGQQLPDDIALLNSPSGDLNGQWRALSRQQGMDPVTEDGQINIVSEQSYRTATLLDDLHSAGLTTRYQGFTDEWAQAYEDGEIASLLSGSWMVGTMETEMPATAGDWGAFRLPAFEPGGRRASNWGGSNLVIPAQISDAAADSAWEYLTWTLAREEMQVLLFQQFGLFPTLELAYDNPIFDEDVAFFDGQQIRQLFIDVAEEIPGWRFSTATPAISQAIEDELAAMLDGEQTPREAVEAAAQTVARETGREIAPASY